MNVKGKMVVVTGASSGIGESTAKLLTKHGAKVALVARSKDKLEKLSKKLAGSFVVRTDMTDETQVRKMIREVTSHYGRIDILINNAGQGYDAPIEKINIDTYRKLFDLNVAGPLIAMQEVIPIMRKQKGGTIVNISSGTALMFLPNMSAYSSLKRALIGITLTAREELKEDNITVSVVYPYITLTNFDKNMVEGGMEFSQEEGENRNLPAFDPPEHVAEIILNGIKSGEAEIFAHDWMKR